MILIAVEHEAFGYFGDGSVDACVKESFFEYALEEFAVVAFAVGDDGSKKVYALA